MKLNLTNQKATLEHVNVRREIHGAESELAADLKFRVALPNDCLACFDPLLKAMLYHFDDARPADLADAGSKGQPGFAPHRRIGCLAMPLKLTSEAVGGALTIHRGLGGASDLDLLDVRVNAVSIDAKEGGTAEVTFRVQIHPDEGILGRLCGLVQEEVEISLSAPEAGGG